MGVCQPILCSTALVFTVNRQPLKHSKDISLFGKTKKSVKLPTNQPQGSLCGKPPKSLQWERFGYHASQMAHRMLSSKDMKPNSIPCLVSPDSHPFTWKASPQASCKDRPCLSRVHIHSNWELWHHCGCPLCLPYYMWRTFVQFYTSRNDCVYDTNTFTQNLEIL